MRAGNSCAGGGACRTRPASSSPTPAFDDAFRLMAWMFVAALPPAPFCRTTAHAQAAPPDAHRSAR